MTAIIDQLAEQLGLQLLAEQAQLITAESCTGGWLAEAITSVAGSSAWFDRGYVCYSNSAKQELLGVKQATLDRHGAVSSETALEMAQGAQASLQKTIQAPIYSVSITGIAGPTGGTEEKPVGTVFIAICPPSSLALTSLQKSQICCELFKGDRHEIRLQAVFAALQNLLNMTQIDLA